MRNITSDIRNDFPLLQNNAVAFLDSAASSQKPQAVLDAIQQFYSTSYANVHRGLYTLSAEATEQYEQARQTVQRFINAEHAEEIIFTSGTTAGINTIAGSLVNSGRLNSRVIILNPGDHHSNIVPWQMAAKQVGAEIRWLPLDEDLRIDVDSINADELFADAAILAFGHISNSLGTIQPAEELIALAHKHNVLVFVDGAQSVPHQPVDVQQLDCDFLVFSGHKMLGPTGIGVLYGKKDVLEALEPWQGGGDMISEVTLTGSTWAELPAKFEAGTPNIAGAIGLAAAVDYLQQFGMAEVQAYCHNIYAELIAALQELPGVTVLGTNDLQKRASAVSFTIDGVHPHDIAEIFNNENVAIRAGHHCAQPTMQLLQVPATARASVYVYTTSADIQALVKAIHSTQKTFNVL